MIYELIVYFIVHRVLELMRWVLLLVESLPVNHRFGFVNKGRTHSHNNQNFLFRYLVFHELPYGSAIVLLIIAYLDYLFSLLTGLLSFSETKNLTIQFCCLKILVLGWLRGLRSWEKRRVAVNADSFFWG